MQFAADKDEYKLMESKVVPELFKQLVAGSGDKWSYEVNVDKHVKT